jgi:signal transduction histidine kinase
MGETKAQRLFADYAQKVGAADIGKIPEDAALVHFVETHLTGAIGSASARIMVASVVEEEALELDDVMRILDEASQLRAYSEALKEKSRSLQQATKELQVANEQLKSLDRLKDNFMSSVTHELRTPLTSIRAMTELMLDDPNMEEKQRLEFLTIVVSESERLSRLVNQVLDMAKIEAGHAEWHSSDVDILDLVTQSVNSISGVYKDRGAILEVHAQKNVSLIRADADRLTQVLLNLLSNAVKFVPKVKGKVEVHIRDATEGITVEVIDNGLGIAPEKQKLVFEKFRQVEGETDRQLGIGLGLPISRQIVEHFGGRMWLRSKVGEGACFGFFLPR